MRYRRRNTSSRRFRPLVHAPETLFLLKERAEQEHALAAGYKRVGGVRYVWKHAAIAVAVGLVRQLQGGQGLSC